MAQGDVLRTSEVSKSKNGIKYILKYEVIDLGKGREGVKFPDGQLILGLASELEKAYHTLEEMINSGQADRNHFVLKEKIFEKAE